MSENEIKNLSLPNADKNTIQITSRKTKARFS